MEPSSPAGLDRVDLFVAPTVEVDIGYPFAAGSLAGPFVFRGVVGDWLLASSSRIYGVDLVTVGPALARVGYLLATRRVGRVAVVCGVVGELFLASPVRIDGVDLVVTVGCVLARVDYLAWLPGKLASAGWAYRATMNSPTAASSPAAATASSAALRWLSLTVLTIFPLPNGRSGVLLPAARISICGHYSECGGVLPPSNE